MRTFPEYSLMQNCVESLRKSGDLTQEESVDILKAGENFMKTHRETKMRLQGSDSMDSLHAATREAGAFIKDMLLEKALPPDVRDLVMKTWDCADKGTLRTSQNGRGH